VECNFKSESYLLPADFHNNGEAKTCKTMYNLKSNLKNFKSPPPSALWNPGKTLV